MKILCVLGEHNYGDTRRGSGYEYVNFLPAFQRMGHEISHFESFSRDAYIDFTDLNRKLLLRVKDYKPDVIFFVLLGYEVWIDTLQLIRDGSNAILINWSTDDSWKYEQFSKFIAPAFHLYVTTYPDALLKSTRDGHTNFFKSQWAANSQQLRPPSVSTRCKYQVSFIGSCYGNRPKWVAGLAERGISVDCFGHGWPNGTVASKDIPEIMNSSHISLNFGDSGLQWRGLTFSRSRQIKARVFEVPGAGGFLMTERAHDMDSCFIINEEIVTFGSLSDLAESIAFYLKHPEQRDRIADAGYRRTAVKHTYEVRFSAVLTAALDAKKSMVASDSLIDMVHFERIAARHKAGLSLLLLKKVMLIPCALVWGKSRGSRAARRILFELSWRFVGSKTYSASGWPGRLFYRES